MGRGRRNATVARNAPQGQIIPLGDSSGRSGRIPPQLAAALQAEPDPESEIQQRPEEVMPTRGEHVRELKISDAEVAAMISGGSDLEHGFVDACVDKALSLHSLDAEVNDLDGEDPDRYIEVQIVDNDGDLVITYLCEKI